MSTSEPGFKRLGFIHSSANYLYSYTYTADKLYRRLKGTLPASVQPTLNKTESTIATYAAPVVARAQDTAEKALHFADDQVDWALNTVDKAHTGGKQAVGDGFNAVRQIHDTNTKLFVETSTAYYDWVKGFADWAKDKLNPVKGGKAALEAFYAAIEKAKEATDPDVAAKMLTDAWNSFSSVPVVAKILDTTNPAQRAALNSFYSLHDRLVSLGLYKRAVDTGSSTLSWATTTPPYKLSAQYLYPIVQPIADPTIEKFSKSKVINTTIKYWQPTATAA